ncbi:unnamed protein product, partial [Heterotrigona itama]
FSVTIHNLLIIEFMNLYKQIWRLQIQDYRSYYDINTNCVHL